MGRTVLAESKILNYLENVGSEVSFSVGLIIGQSIHSGDYVVHFARTQLDEELSSYEELKTIDPLIVADHAKHVIRMLPGGFSVLGVYSHSSVSEPEVEPLRKILISLRKVLIDEPFQIGSSQSELLVFCYNVKQKNYTCQTIGISSSVLGDSKRVDWKFKDICTNWCQISSKFDMHWPSVGGKTSLQLKTHLKNFLTEMNKLLNAAVIVIDGEVQSHLSLKSLKSSENQKKSKEGSGEIQQLKAEILIPLKDASGDDDILIVDCDVELNLMGILRSQVFVSENGTLGEALTAIKQDIVRSLSARMEMHWDSLIEEEYGSPEDHCVHYGKDFSPFSNLSHAGMWMKYTFHCPLTMIPAEKQSLHEPPRRVSIYLPGTEICFSDYIFPGEGANEVISTFKELMDIEITEENVDQNFEIHGDPLHLCGKSSANVFSTPSDDLLNSSLPTKFLVAAFSFAVILIAIAVALQIQRNSQNEKNIS